MEADSAFSGETAGIVYDEAISAIPDDVGFRLRFLEVCGGFPQTEMLRVRVLER